MRMKTLRLLTLALFAVSTAAAQGNRGFGYEDEYSPTVYLISVNQPDMRSDCPCPAKAAELNRLAAEAAILDYRETHRPGFQQVEKPQFIFTTKNNKFSLALGGYINMRAGYDLEGIVNNIDFVPADIPMTSNYANGEKLMMDATTSRVFLKAITNTRALGRVVVFIDGDFRGGRENSYVPRLRSAYVSMLGFTLGRDVTTFCDLLAGPNTIDFRGPNAYNLHFATMIRYEVPFANNHMKFGFAAEMPSVSGTYGDNMVAVPARMPDFPVFLQVAWGPERRNHIRASAVFRNMYMHNIEKNYTLSKFGWGVQGSGHITIARAFELFFNGVYGEGISRYIQDLAGQGLDLTPIPNSPPDDADVRLAGCRTDQLLAPRIHLGRLLDGRGMPQERLLLAQRIPPRPVHLRQHLLPRDAALQARRRVPLRHAQEHGQRQEPRKPREPDGSVQLLMRRSARQRTRTSHEVRAFFLIA